MTLTCIEFYCGIGGFSAALAGGEDAGPAIGPIEIVSAVDIDRQALSVYQANFPGRRTRAAEIASLRPASLVADLWWLSPPCLPFTRKGNQRDRDDRRAESLLALIARVTAATDYPRMIAIENVPPFASSQTGRWVRQHLVDCGFDCDWELRCPSELGWPMRRMRSYLLASRDRLRPLAEPSCVPRALSTFIDPARHTDPTLAVPLTWLERYPAAIDLIDPADPAARAACFTSSYTKMPIRSGSYIRLDEAGTRARFFSPTEVLKLLGFPPEFCWPDETSTRRRWALAGNSLSLPVVRWVLSRLGLSEPASFAT